MKLVIQIPCYNEAETLPSVLAGIPKSISGISSIETLVIDDGSNDGTSDVAKKHGANYVVRHTSNLGLAFSFRRGIDEALKHGADIIVNIDGDNQYRGSDIPNLIAPILERRADIVIGDRQTHTITEFSLVKKVLQRFGTYVVRRLSNIRITDAVSGFRAFSRSAALKVTILGNYTYTIESILQARLKGLIIEEVKVVTNPKTRESRLMRSIRSYLAFSVSTIIRIFTMYNPLRVFVDLGALVLLIGAFLAVRFVYFYFTDGGSGHIQSLIFAAISITIGASIILVGLIADLIQFNRRLLEDILERVRKIELQNLKSNNSDQSSRL